MYTDFRSGIPTANEGRQPAPPTFQSPEGGYTTMSKRTQTDRRDVPAAYEIMQLLGRCGTLYTSLHQMEMAPLLGLSLSDTQALTLMAQEESLSTGSFRRLAGLSTGGATATIDRLERRGLIRRRTHPTDRRITVLQIVPERCAGLLRIPAGTLNELVNAQSQTSTAQLEIVQNLLLRTIANLKAKMSNAQDGAD